jgi:hypothetical protein
MRVWKTDRIKSFSISDLKSGWKVPLEQLIEVARQIIKHDLNSNSNKAKREKLERSLYSGPTSGQRMSNFIRTVTSISTNGYKTELTHPGIITANLRWQIALPRINPDLGIDDGRHRIAALVATGVTDVVCFAGKIIEIPNGDKAEEIRKMCRIHKELIEKEREKV